MKKKLCTAIFLLIAGLGFYKLLMSGGEPTQPTLEPEKVEEQVGTLPQFAQQYLSQFLLSPTMYRYLTTNWPSIKIAEYEKPIISMSANAQKIFIGGQLVGGAPGALIDTKSKRVIKEWENISSADLSKDGSRLILNPWQISGWIFKLINAENGAEITQGEGCLLQISDDTKILLQSLFVAKTYILINANGEALWSSPQFTGLYGAISQDGSRLFVEMMLQNHLSSSLFNIKVMPIQRIFNWENISWKIYTRANDMQQPNKYIMSDDGSKLFLINSSDHKGWLIDGNTGRTLWQMDGVAKGSLSADGSRLFIETQNENGTLINLKTFEKVASWPYISRAYMSPDGKTMILRSEKSEKFETMLINTHNGRQIGQWQQVRHIFYEENVFFGGDYVLLPIENKGVMLVNCSTGEEIGRWLKAKGLLSSDGSKLAINTSGRSYLLNVEKIPLMNLTLQRLNIPQTSLLNNIAQAILDTENLRRIRNDNSIAPRKAHLNKDQRAVYRSLPEEIRLTISPYVETRVKIRKKS